MLGFIQNIVCLTILINYIPESIKWSYDNGRYNECYETLKIIAKSNKINLKSKEQLNLNQINKNYNKTAPK